MTAADTLLQFARISEPAFMRGRYRLVEVIGSGRFGTVYAAEHVDTRHEVALKVLHAGRADEGEVERFRREAETVQSLRHPNTVRVLDFGQADGVWFIAYELLRGSALSEIVRNQAPLGVRATARIARQVASALAEAHAVGVVHRDVKPANLFLTTRNGEPDFVKVIDFGVAKRLSGSRRALTDVGEVMDTPSYTAPEQVLTGHAFPATDLYALGLVMAEMLCGRRIYSGNPSEVWRMQAAEAPVPLPEVVQRSQLGHVIAKATEKQLCRRYTSAAEMLWDLERCPLGAGSPAREASPLAQRGCWTVPR